MRLQPSSQSDEHIAPDNANGDDVVINNSDNEVRAWMRDFKPVDDPDRRAAKRAQHHVPTAT